MRREEKDFTDKYKAMHGGTTVNAMLEYRNMKKTNTPYTRPPHKRDHRRSLPWQGQELPGGRVA